jgi:serine/threonine-protein kinase RsbW
MKDHSSRKEWTILSASFPATLADVDQVCEDAKVLLDNNGLGRSSFLVELLLREALNNAVIHGTGKNPDKFVRCRLSYSDENCVILLVEDEGKGFDWHKHLSQDVNKSADSLRGLAMMKLYSKVMLFNEKGNRVELRIDLSPEGKGGEPQVGKPEDSNDTRQSRFNISPRVVKRVQHARC